MIQIGLRLHDGEKLPLNQLLPMVKKAGFKCAHLALKKSINDYSTDTTALTPGYAMHLRHLFCENYIDIAVLGCYLDISSPTVDINRYLAHIRIASLMNAGVVGTETNGTGDYDTLIKNLKRVVEYAEKMGVIFAIEPVSTHVVSTPEIARKVLDDINSPNLGIIFDPVNLLSVDNYNRREEIHRRAIELLGNDIMVVHIKDFVIEEGKLVSVGAGLGMMDYREILTYLKANKPFIHATLEDTKPETAALSKEHIEKILREIK